MQFTIHMPIKPHFRPFFSQEFELNPYRLSLRDPLGCILLLALDRPVVKNCNEINGYDDVLEVVIPIGYCQFNKVIATDKSVRVFNALLQRMFKNSFRRYVDLYLLLAGENKGSAKISAGINSFMKLYELHDSMDYDCLKQDYYRYRRKKGLKTNRFVNRN